MPRISEFYGIVIEMYFADHPPPPHLHARCAGEEATLVRATGAVLAGSCPCEPFGLCEDADVLYGAFAPASGARIARRTVRERALATPRS